MTTAHPDVAMYSSPKAAEQKLQGEANQKAFKDQTAHRRQASQWISLERSYSVTLDYYPAPVSEVPFSRPVSLASICRNLGQLRSAIDRRRQGVKGTGGALQHLSNSILAPNKRDTGSSSRQIGRHCLDPCNHS